MDKEQKTKRRKPLSKAEIIKMMKRYSHYNRTVVDGNDENTFNYKNKTIHIKK